MIIFTIVAFLVRMFPTAFQKPSTDTLVYFIPTSAIEYKTLGFPRRETLPWGVFYYIARLIDRDLSIYGKEWSYSLIELLTGIGQKTSRRDHVLCCVIEGQSHSIDEISIYITPIYYMYHNNGINNVSIDEGANEISFVHMYYMFAKLRHRLSHFATATWRLYYIYIKTPFETSLVNFQVVSTEVFHLIWLSVVRKRCANIRRAKYFIFFFRYWHVCRLFEPFVVHYLRMFINII